MRLARHLCAAALAVGVFSGCFLDHGVDDAGAIADGGDRGDADGAAECATLGGYRTCGSLCADGCPRSDGCQQYFDICVPFPDVTGCDVTLSSHERDYPNRTYCGNGLPCVVSTVALERAHSVLGLCVRDEYCREVQMSSIDPRCVWSDESPYVDGPPEVSECPSTPDARVPFCGGPCGGCDDTGWSSYYEPANCVGLSERRGFGVCTFEGHDPCWRGHAGAAGACAFAERWGEPCACMVLELPDGSFQEIGFPTLASSCLEYLRHFPDTVRCMDPFAWVPLEP